VTHRAHVCSPSSVLSGHSFSSPLDSKSTPAGRPLGFNFRTIFGGLLLTIILAALVEQLNFRRKVSSLHGIPGPSWVVPFIGGIVSMVRGPTAFWHGQFAMGEYSWNSIVGQFVVVVTEAATVRKVFMNVSATMPLALHPNAKALLGNDNIAFLNGQEHRQLRARLLPLFTTRALDMYIDLQVAAVRKHLAQWDLLGATKASPLNMRGLIYDLNTYTSMTVFMGPYLNETDRAQLVRDYQILTEGMFGMPIPLPGFAVYAGIAARPRILKTLEKIVLASKARLGETDAQPQCLVDFWMQATLAAEADAAAAGESAPLHTDGPSCAKILLDFIFAAQDASTSALTFTTHFMGIHTELLDKVRKEVRGLHREMIAAGTSTETEFKLDASCIPKLPYTYQVVKEVLRVCPPATIVPHQTMHDFEISPTHTLPAGTLVVPSIWNSNRTGFENPEKFDPDRFNEERAEHKKFASEFLTFGAGAHGCMGQRYAQNHLVIYLAILAYEHDFTRSITETMHQIKYLPTIYPEDDCVVEKFQPADLTA
jgi:cytochrome P450 family 710 subfamily A protein